MSRRHEQDRACALAGQADGVQHDGQRRLVVADRQAVGGPLDPGHLGRLRRDRALGEFADVLFVERNGDFDVGPGPLGDAAEEFADQVAARARHGGRRRRTEREQDKQKGLSLHVPPVPLDQTLGTDDLRYLI
ncbi:MAG: hypothetical protein AMS14_02450 [Planctomycetes bacterium DG_20]|nr:MAG: hypothetical protein AMS14_02450 [Planctomycetes bacterium DG_20]